MNYLVFNLVIFQVKIVFHKKWKPFDMKCDLLSW